MEGLLSMELNKFQVNLKIQDNKITNFFFYNFNLFMKVFKFTMIFSVETHQFKMEMHENWMVLLVTTLELKS